MLKLLSLLALVAYTSASDVLVYTDSDFTEKAAEEDIVLVEFYAPWCGHCKKLAPEYEKAATILKSADPPVSLAKVDCTEAGKEVCSKYDVKGFPTLKVFKAGEMAFEYQGPRDADGIVKYMKSKAGPVSKELKSVADAEKFLSSDDHSLIGFFESDSIELAKSFKKLADALNEDYRFAHTYNKDVAEKYGYSNNVVIFQPKRLQNRFEDSQIIYKGDDALYTMKSWVKDNVFGLCAHRTSGNQGQFKKPLIVAYYDVDYVKNPKGSNYWRNRVMKVAKKLADEGKTAYFAVSNIHDFSHEVDEYGLKDEGDKPVVGAKNAKDEKFVMTAEFSVDNLEKFVNDLLAGNLKPYLKSEAIPEDNDGPVKVVVAQNFNDIVNDETKDVLLEFYAPWCGHCKNLAPKFEELGEKLSDDDSVTIAKMDATVNDVPSQYEVRGFPTLFYVPKGNKSNPKKYEGGREVDDFIKYLAKESTDGLKSYNRNGKKKKVPTATLR